MQVTDEVTRLLNHRMAFELIRDIGERAAEEFNLNVTFAAINYTFRMIAALETLAAPKPQSYWRGVK